MLDGDELDWELWEPMDLFEEKIKHPRYSQIREADKYQRRGDTARAQPIYAQECKRCDKTVLEACAAAHEAELHRSLGEWERAIEDYRRAFECFRFDDQPHNVAVTHLMLGLCYQANGNYAEAVEQFTQAHALFDTLLRKHREQGNRRHAGQYRALCEQTLLLQSHTNALAKAARNVATPAVDTSSAHIKVFITHADRAALRARGYTDTQIDQMRPEQAQQILEKKRPREDERARDNSTVQVIPIFDQALANGSGVWMNPEEQLEGYLCVSEFEINGRSYNLVNLTERGNHLHLKRDSQYGCVRVVGDSMNERGIEPNDYIIVERQREFQNGDLVAAALVDDTGRYGLVKQIRIERDQTGAITTIQLIPRSRNAMHKTRVFDLHNGGQLPDWIGRVVAVLKPVD